MDKSFRAGKFYKLKKRFRPLRLYGVTAICGIIRKLTLLGQAFKSLSAGGAIEIVTRTPKKAKIAGLRDVLNGFRLRRKIKSL